MKALSIPIRPLGGEGHAPQCDPQCRWRIGSLPAWFCDLFQRPLACEDGLATRCLECLHAESEVYRYTPPRYPKEE